MNDLPIRTANGATTYMRDVANVRDGYAVQQNIVRVNGRRASLLTVLKNGQASTLSIVKDVKKALIRIQSGLPPELNIRQLFRSVDLRQSGDQRRAAGRDDRRRAHGLNDSAVSGELALHANRLHFRFRFRF